MSPEKESKKRRQKFEILGLRGCVKAKPKITFSRFTVEEEGVRNVRFWVGTCCYFDFVGFWGVGLILK